MRRDEGERVYAGFGVRLFAYLTDLAVLSIPLAGIRTAKLVLSWINPAGFLVRSVLFRYSLLDIALYLAATLYFVLMTYFSGGTLGKHLLHLRVVSTEDRPLTLWEVLIREVIGRYLSGAVAMLGYLCVLVDPEKRAIHDHVADTCVVYDHRRVPAGRGGQASAADSASPGEFPPAPQAHAGESGPEGPAGSSPEGDGQGGGEESPEEPRPYTENDDQP